MDIFNPELFVNVATRDATPSPARKTANGTNYLIS